ncbi:hypothetical protein [Streptomyces sp. SBT349]|uniref:YqeB family protein n=1 Tax=Streptomyces sp. SBT349 TaxID=1580539 RepID=UPI0007C68180|nr:hypothetical protein [Streptomyces sp. SBT349]
MRSSETTTGETGVTVGTAKTTELGLSLVDRLLIIVGAPVLGALLGIVLPSVAEWAADRPWLPVPGPFEVIASFEGRWVAIALGGAGLLLGLVGAAFIVASCLKVTLSDQEIRVEKDSRTRIFARQDVGTVFMDGKQLVILDRETRQLMREAYEGRAGDLACGFGGHGYPWAEGGDPYEELYRRWVPDHPDLPPAANAVLKAREKALEKKQRDDVTELGEEVQKLGFVVRDRSSRQYWRPLAGR